MNNGVPFGEVRSSEDKRSLRDRPIVTVTVLLAQGLFGFVFLVSPDEHQGVAKEETAETLTHAAFCAG